MEFFSKISETIATTGKDVTNKAKDLTEIAKINLEIKGKEDYICKQYEVLGSKYFELHKNDYEPLMDEIVSINAMLSEIKTLKQKIAEIKGMKFCPECGESMEMYSKFCNKCGQKWEEIYEEE